MSLAVLAIVSLAAIFDTDSQGWAHIAFSHDSPTLGGSGTYTGYAVQSGGTPVGEPNN